MKIDLKGKNILVTGASRGIGKAIAEQLLKSGAKVGAHYSTTPIQFDDLTEEENARVVTLRANLSDANETAALFANAVDKMGSIDVLINNAGLAIRTNPDAELNEFVESWQTTMAVNLQAVGILCTRALSHFSDSGGIIINISSRAAFRGDTPEYLAYAASKGGIVSLTRSIARGYGKKGVIAFNVAPGFVKTDMAYDFIEAYGEGIVKNDIALETLTTPQDLAPLITLLASGMANHATGATFDVNAGSYVH